MGRFVLLIFWYGYGALYINGLDLGYVMKLCFSYFQDPQVVTGSHDTTIKFWDLRFGN